MRQMHQPVLSFPLNIDHVGRIVVLSNASERIQFEGIAPSVAIEVLERLNNRDDVTNSNPETFSKFVDTLKRESLAFEAEAAVCTGKRLAVLLQGYFSDWNQELFSTLLWTSLVTGTAEKRVVDGWLIESYHFIRGANARLSYAAAHANDDRVRDIFAHHYVEEYDHHKLFAESLRLRGIDPTHVDLVGPLPTTQAVQDMARYAARADCLAYAACSGLLESTGSDAAHARDFYNRIRDNYDAAGAGFVAPLLKHIDIDEAYEHGSILRDVFDPIAVISAEQADRIIQIAYRFKESLQFWFDDIVRSYFSTEFDPKSVRRNYRANRSV